MLYAKHIGAKDGIPSRVKRAKFQTETLPETGIAPTGFAAAMLARMGDGVIF
jgi:hypothetical protein